MAVLEPADGPIGFIGLGKMGLPMCRRLLSAGWSVIGYDAMPALASELVELDGFVLSDASSELAKQASVVILMLPNSDIVDAVALDGLAGKLAPGSVVIDMSSSVPDRTRALAERLAEHKIVLVDAPVSGGVTGAVAGSLTIMVGGPVESVERVRPLLSAMGARIERVGDAGAGHALKALNNLMSAAHLWASSEALLAAEKFGLDIPTSLELINSSSGRSGSTQQKWPNFVLTDRFDSGFALTLMRKDVQIAADLIHGLGLPSLVSDIVASAWTRAEQDLPVGADHTEIVRWLRRDATASHHENANICP